MESAHRLPMEIGAIVGRSLFNNADVRTSPGRIKTAEIHESLEIIAADQEAGSTIFGWAKEYDSSAGAQDRAIDKCQRRDGQPCMVRVWSCTQR